MKIWVDADACPRVIKEILFRAAERAKVRVTLVANQSVTVPRSPFIQSVQVASGFDVADNHIVQQAQKGDLVVTADIPLASEAIDKGCLALNPRGDLYTEENIRQRLNMRDFMDTLRGSGIDTGGPAAFSQADRMAFANQLDRLLAQQAGKNVSS
ncbi:MAG: YaiI/YqxD family protein [Xanthomonadales bacterium]|nr:YaiI/YqxD family protein [Gammaproteobacteria bacterium]MBT8049683.1 YaiI/YqxD family protein [Gammaproteobacteria bacterium]MBT8055349.1 YaiI/YqxD family protein [Gammaproteobacteria bacterium]NNJ79737.1 YaiI/YqxD family protein [Xanthomonadales bacterium]NNL05301.1 YaiI/YqxD family protein [Xanthomonadales bacterium]